jgi:BirA family transcriptional regulator, biotin operon repressor / biotin---[acetyl-CoA-carboxylase] ligase
MALEGTNLYKEEVIAGFKCKFFHELDSTNDFAKENLEDLMPLLPGVIAAEFQKEGKGQLDREWESEPGKNLLASVMLKPGFALAEGLFRVNYILTFSLIRTFRELYNLEASLKWPNDIFVGNKKIAGILAENTISGEKITTVIGGIGVNINQSFAQNKEFSATSIFDETGKEIEPYKFLSDFLKMLKDVNEKSAFTSLNFLEEKISNYLWNRNREQKFVDRDSGKSINAYPDKFCSDHRLLVRHNGINKKLTHEQFQWVI